MAKSCYAIISENILAKPPDTNNIGTWHTRNNGRS